MSSSVMSTNKRLRMSGGRLPTSRTKFTSLPAEIITQIVLLLDLQSAMALARVSQYFREPADARIWSHLNLTIDASLYASAHTILGLGEERYADDLKARARMLLGVVSGERKDKVSKVTLVPCSGSTHLLVDILDRVSPNIKQLEVLGRDADADGKDWHPDEHDMLDLRLLRRQLQCPLLTHLTLGDNSIRYIGFIGLLCELAPNLKDVDITISRPLPRPLTPFPPLRGPTKIERARLYCVWGSVPGPSQIANAMDLLSVVDSSPLLRQLTIYSHTASTELDQHLSKVIRCKEEIQDLHWLHDLEDFNRLMPVDPGALLGLRRLVIPCWDWQKVFRHLPCLPALQILHCHRWSDKDIDEGDVYENEEPMRTLLEITPRTGFADPSPARPMPPLFAQRLRKSPQLRYINILDVFQNEGALDSFTGLDDIERSGNLTSYIRSFRNGDEELLHARMLLHRTWDLDCEKVQGVAVPDYLRGQIWFDTEDREQLEELFPGQPLATWVTFTDFDGLTVPLSVIERMKEVEGGMENWEGRGIEVGEAAWKVLLDWKAGVEAAMQYSREDMSIG